MSHCLILQHDDAFGPGRLVSVFNDFGIPIRVQKLHRNPLLDPGELDEVRILVLLGGPQRLTETGDDYGPRLPWLDAEVEAIKGFVNDDRPVLGFGLGAQLLAKAGGADVTPLTTGEGEDQRPNPHLGWGTIKLPFPGGTDPILFGLGDGSPMFFWQKDSFGLPKLPPPPGFDPNKPGPPPPTGNFLLSSSAWDRNAAFRFKNHLYGFAYHPELTVGDIHRVLDAHGGAVGAAHGSGALDKVKSDTERHAERQGRLGTRLLENVVQYMKAYDPPM